MSLPDVRTLHERRQHSEIRELGQDADGNRRDGEQAEVVRREDHGQDQQPHQVDDLVGAVLYRLPDHRRSGAPGHPGEHVLVLAG